MNMNEERKSKLVLLLVYITIFVNSIVLFAQPFEFYIGYFVYLLLFPALLPKHGVPKNVLLLFLFLLFYGIFQVSIGNNTYGFFFKIYIGVLMAYLFYYVAIAEYNFDVKRLFAIYLKGCYIVCFIGIIQFVSYLVHFTPGYDYQWLLNKWSMPQGGNFGVRINSIFGEPSYYSIFTSSAVFIAIRNFMFKDFYVLNRFQSAVVIVGSLLSFSGIGYLGIFIAIILLLLNFGLIRYFLFFIPVSMLVFYIMYENVPDFRDRYESTVEVFTTGKFQIGKTHGSSIILYNNYHVAVENFKDYFLGTGLGSHPIAYEKYSLTKDIKVHGFELNSLDANSMFNRLLSETGILGVGLFFFLIYKCFVKRSEGMPEDYWLISNAILVMILLNLFRQGHYFLNGFPFFVWLYYFNSAKYRNETQALHAHVAEA